MEIEIYCVFERQHDSSQLFSIGFVRTTSIEIWLFSQLEPETVVSINTPNSPHTKCFPLSFSDFFGVVSCRLMFIGNKAACPKIHATRSIRLCGPNRWTGVSKCSCTARAYHFCCQMERIVVALCSVHISFSDIPFVNSRVNRAQKPRTKYIVILCYTYKPNITNLPAIVLRNWKLIYI